MISNDKQNTDKEFSLSNKKFSTHRKVSDKSKKISTLCVASTISLFTTCFDTVELSIPIPQNKIKIAYKLAKDLHIDCKTIDGLFNPRVIKIDTKKGVFYYFSFKLSTKCLGINYFQGFTLDTYDEVIKFCQLYLRDVFDFSDLTNDKILVYSGDLKYDYCCPDAKKVIRSYRAISKYDSENYDRITKKSNEIKYYNTNTTTSLRFQFLIYYKTKEFNLKRNKYLKDYFDDAGIIFKSEIVRFELQMSSPKMLNRFLYGVDSSKMHTLYELLQPKPIVNPIYTAYKLIFPDISSDCNYDTNWIDIMKTVGPMKFAELIGIIVISIFCGDDINKVKLAYKQAYSSNSSLSKEKFAKLIKAIPSKKTLTPKIYSLFKSVILKRLAKQLNLLQVKKDSLFEMVEQSIQCGKNEVYNNIVVKKPESFFARTIKDYNNTNKGDR